MRGSSCLSLTVAVIGVVLSLAGAMPAASDEPLLRLRAFAVDIAGRDRPRTGTLDIVIERWSTEEERNRLRDALVEKGSDKLLSTLQDIKPRAGYIRPDSGLGWDVHYAIEIPAGDGGRRIIVATDRPMSFWELHNRPRSADYEFIVAEIRLNKLGRGEGKLAGAAKISYDQGTRTVEIENYGIEPVRLTQVEVTWPKPKKE